MLQNRLTGHVVAADNFHRYILPDQPGDQASFIMRRAAGDKGDFHSYKLVRPQATNFSTKAIKMPFRIDAACDMALENTNDS